MFKFAPREILLCLLVFISKVFAYPNVPEQVPLTSPSLKANKNESAIRPLVIWHGMGDTYASAGMLKFEEYIKETHPGIFVHRIYVDENPDADLRADYFGDLNDQLAIVADELASIEELKDGFDGVAFSQGGQFFRGFVERYNYPPVHNLITFGSQHMGVADIPSCKPNDLLCLGAHAAAKRGVYTEWVQSHIIQAQYYRDPERLSEYYEKNHFMPSINNEVPSAVNTTYAENLSSLHRLVLVLFSKDELVVPKESSWFGSYTPSEEDNGGGAGKTIIPMRLQPIYLADTIGLRTLDEKGGIVLELCEGGHMHLTRECWEPLIKRFAGGKL